MQQQHHDTWHMHAGDKWYYFVWVDQWLSLLCSDIGLFILAGESIKVRACQLICLLPLGEGFDASANQTGAIHVLDSHINITISFKLMICYHAACTQCNGVLPSDLVQLIIHEQLYFGCIFHISPGDHVYTLLTELSVRVTQEAKHQSLS